MMEDVSSEPLSQWKDANFSEFQAGLKETSQQIISRVQQSEDSRKKLIDSTKAFRSQMSAKTRQEVSSILRLYQAEIDSLSKRAKASESAFVDVFSALSDLPDPVSLVENVCEELENTKLELEDQRTSEKDQEIEELNQRLEAYENEILEVKNQEVTINSLKNELKETKALFHSKISSSVTDKVTQLEANHTMDIETMGKQLVENEAKNKELTEELTSTKQSLERTQKEYFESKTHYEDKINALQHQMDLLHTDNDRSLALAIQSQIASSAAANIQSTDESVNDLIKEKEETISRLQDEVHSKEDEINIIFKDREVLKTNFQQQTIENENIIKELKEAQLVKEQQVSDIQQELDSQNDYEEIKRQLEIFKSLELDFEGEGEDKTEEADETLEVLLLKKNKNLKTKLSSLNYQVSQQENQISDLQTAKETLETEMREKADVIRKMEADLYSYNNVYNNSTEFHFSKTPENNSNLSLMKIGSDNTNHGSNTELTIDQAFKSNSSGLSRDLSEAERESQEIVLDIVGSSAAQSTMAATETNATETDNLPSMLEIVSGQRDRFRARNMQLEDDAEQLQHHVDDLTQEMDDIRNDNVKLYEKIKFLQSYQGQSMSQTRSSSSIESATENKYSEQYENKINPFTEFHRKERSSRYDRLSTPEKATLSVTRFVIGNKAARSFFFFYALMLHLLVLVTMYSVSHMETHYTEHDCSAKFAQHMLEHRHGEVPKKM